MAQTFLNFSVEGTQDRLTANAGMILFGEYCKAIGLEKQINTHLPLPRSNRGFDPFEHMMPLILMLHSGGHSLEDIRLIKSDKALRSLLKMERIATADGIGKWLGRLGLAGVYGIETINRFLLSRHLKTLDKEPLVLDIDASVIESHKSTAAYTYKKVPGFTPMIGHINGGYVIHSEFRSGNIAPADTNLSFVKRCAQQLPNTQTFSFIRADSASYQAALFDYCDDNAITYTIGGQLDSSALNTIREMTQWEEFSPCESIGESLHTMINAKNAFRLIVVKKSITPQLPTMQSLFTEEELQSYIQEKYHIIATNADESLSAQEIVSFYRQRGNESENRIKELKNGFNLSYLPSSNFMSNAFYWSIGTLSHNLFILFKQMLEHSKQHHTVATIRHQLYHLAGKVIVHGRQTILKINTEFISLFHTIRGRIFSASLE